MMAAWVIFGLLMGVLVAIAALGAESMLRAARHETRWLWLAALALTVGFTLVAPLRPVSVPATAGVRMPLPVILAAAPTGQAKARWSLSVVTAPLEHAVARVARAMPPLVTRWLGMCWLALSGVTLLAFVAVYARFRRARRDWPHAELCGSVVRLAPHTGPAVIGLAGAEIVVPHWLLRRSDREQHLVVAHEREHLRAGDPWLLAMGCGAAVLLPWHPAAWWMLGRLRLAVELDCDRRVLASGAGAHSYGSLLIELASHGSSLRAGALALADNPSHLERRLKAMTTRYTRAKRARAGMFGAFALAALVIACDSRLPTSAEVNNMDVASASRAVRLTPLALPGSGATIYLVDGRRVSAAEANALPADSIATITIMKPAAGGGDSARMIIHTGVSALANSPRWLASRAERNRVQTLRDTLQVRFRQRGPDAGAFSGLLIVDGAPASASRLQSLLPDSITSIEVLKGARAMQLYTEPKARNGVIRITTRARNRRN